MRPSVCITASCHGLHKYTDLNQYFQCESVVITTLRCKTHETYRELLLTFMRLSGLTQPWIWSYHSTQSDAASPAVKLQIIHHNRFLDLPTNISSGLPLEKWRHVLTLMTPSWPTLHAYLLPVPLMPEHKQSIPLCFHSREHCHVWLT